MTTSDLEPPAEEGTALGKRGRRKSLSNLQRELSEDELKSPAVQRILVEDNENLVMEVRELSRFRDRFHSADKSVAVLEERLRGSWTRDACLGGGALIVGVASSHDLSSPAWWIVGGLGVVLVSLPLLIPLLKQIPRPSGRSGL